ncbi:MAG: thiamine phosphate synthase [Labilithrix sp.]|nr:thiamine phosphate synthase [Labilithrix sp.]MCW5814683.1 thiamine phosphate synthase [Labilithrix sp.]
MKGLYAIVDTGLLARRGTDPIAYARAILEARPAALQLRAKDVPARAILSLLRALGPLCRQAGVPLVANDRADLATLAGCDVVHIGQEDLPYDLVHRIAPQLSVGISTHDLAQLERALADKPGYVAFGPVFATMTKVNPDPVVGIDGLRAAAAKTRAAGVPLVAIGGITLANAAEVAPHADAFAVIADLHPEGASLREVTERARAFQAAFGVPRIRSEVA